MAMEKATAPREQKRLERKEEETWLEFYPQARRDPTLAAEILFELDRDDVLRRRHRGLYLCCQRCIRLHESREALHRRIGQAVRRMLRAVFISLPMGAVDCARKACHLAMACIPEDVNEASERQARRLLEGDASANADRAYRKRARKAAIRSDLPAFPVSAAEMTADARVETPV
jgi:hypothetical protein